MSKIYFFCEMFNFYMIINEHNNLILLKWLDGHGQFLTVYWSPLKHLKGKIYEWFLYYIIVNSKRKSKKKY